jgi:hypothetical protein
MYSRSVTNWIQILTAIAVLLGLGLVVWELQRFEPVRSDEEPLFH